MKKNLVLIRDWYLTHIKWKRYHFGKNFHAGRNVILWAKSHINIGDNVYIGAGARILANIGDNVIIGANSVVLKNISGNCIVAGNPAVVVKSLGNKENSDMLK